MPEIAEGMVSWLFLYSLTRRITHMLLVARIVHFLKLTLVGKRIAQASAIDDSNVFGKVGTTGADVAAALKGKKASLIP